MPTFSHATQRYAIYALFPTKPTICYQKSRRLQPATHNKLPFTQPFYKDFWQIRAKFLFLHS